VLGEFPSLLGRFNSLFGRLGNFRVLVAKSTTWRVNPAVIGVSARFSQYLPVEQRNQRGVFFVIAPTRNTDPNYSFNGAGGET
jgi:hypothetical protein